MKNQKEIWKDIIGYEDFYQISNFGRIKSLFRVIQYTFKSGVKRNKRIKECIMATSSCKGYNSINLTKQNKKTSFRVCRLVAIAFIPNPENKPCVNHIDGDKANDNISNLEWCTYSENMYHAVNTGLNVAKKGDERHNSIKIKCTNTGRVFSTINEASKYANTHESHLSRMLRGIYKNKTSLVYA